jgi:hypothetical protein
MTSCANCSTKLTKTSRYCPQCGHPAAAGDTKVMELPPDETGRVPVQYVHAEPRYYGITPTTLVLVLGGVALTLAVVLFALGRWPFGLIALGVSVLLVLVFLEAARRKPDGAVARSTADALDSFRARAGVAADSLATRGRAARRLLALRRELQRMGQLRARLLFELGDAVYRGDDQATERGRGQVRELDELAAQRGPRWRQSWHEPRRGSNGAGWRFRRLRWWSCPISPPSLGRALLAALRSSPSPIRRQTRGTRPSRRIMPEPGPLAPEEPREGRRGT